MTKFFLPLEDEFDIFRQQRSQEFKLRNNLVAYHKKDGTDKSLVKRNIEDCDKALDRLRKKLAFIQNKEQA